MLPILLLWSGLAADTLTSRHQLESNPALASSGRFNTTRYLVLNVPLNSFATFVTLRHPHSRALRVALAAAGAEKLGVAVRNLRER